MRPPGFCGSGVVVVFPVMKDTSGEYMVLNAYFFSRFLKQIQDMNSFAADRAMQQRPRRQPI